MRDMSVPEKFGGQAERYVPPLELKLPINRENIANLVLSASLAGLPALPVEPAPQVFEMIDAQEQREAETNTVVEPGPAANLNPEAYDPEGLRAPAAMEVAPVTPQNPIIGAVLEPLTITHQVVPGESLSVISRIYGIDVTTLTSQVEDPNLIFPNQVISVAVTGAFSIETNGRDIATIAEQTGVPASAILQVNPGAEIELPARIIVPRAVDLTQIQPGDTLSAIAADHSRTVEELVRLNGIVDPAVINAGDYLAIPPTPLIEVLQPTAIVEILRGVTLSDLAAAILEHSELPVTQSAISELATKIQQASGIQDPAKIPVGEEIVLPGVTMEEAASVVQGLSLYSRGEEMGDGQVVVAEAPAAETSEAAPAEAGALVEGLASENGLILPPNLGPVNSEGYFRMPESLNGAYMFSIPDASHGMSGTPERSRCASLETVSGIYAAAQVWNERYPEHMIVIGHLNEEEGHATHNNGTDGDITVLSRMAANIAGDWRLSLELAQVFTEQSNGNLRQILFTTPETNQNDSEWAQLVVTFNEWSAANGYSTIMTPFANHHHHFHLDYKDEFAGQYSGQCAHDTQDGVAPTTEHAVDPALEQQAAEITVPSIEEIRQISAEDYIGKYMNGVRHIYTLSNGETMEVPTELQKWVHYYFAIVNGESDEVVAEAYKVVDAESDFDVGVIGFSGNDYGYFQVNGIHVKPDGIGAEFGYDINDLMTAEANVHLASILYVNAKGEVYPADWPERCGQYGCDIEAATAVVGQQSDGWRDWFMSVTKHGLK